MNESRGSRFNTLFPLWIYDRTRTSRGDHTYLSLAWPIYARRRSPDESSDRIFPLWSSYRDPNGYHSDRYGLFLAGDIRDAAGHRHWIAPLYYRDETSDTFLSLPYAQWGHNRAIPLLLSGWGPEKGLVLLGLGGWNRDESWLFPLWYRNPDTFLSLPYAAGPDYRAIPPLLSAWGDDWGLLAGGIAGWNEGSRWVAPLYYRDPENGLFLSPLYASGPDWSSIPPLLSAWGDNWGRIALGLAGWDGAQGSGNRRSWVAPLYYQDDDKILTPLYANIRRETILPPLLSAWKDSGSWGRILLGLAGWDLDAHWIFPLYYRDPSENTFLTPLLGRFGDGDRYWATPLVGTHSSLNGTTGSWFFPLWDFRYKGDTYDHNVLLLGGAERTDAHHSSIWFSPLFHDISDDGVANLRAEMDSPSAPDRSFLHLRDLSHITGTATRIACYDSDHAAEGTSILLGLGGTRHSVKLSPPTDRLGRDFPPPDADGPFANFLRPPDASATNAVARYLAEDESWFFPLWDDECRRGVMFDIASGEKRLDATLETFSALWFLYDWRRESIPEESHDYVRRRVLWRLYHYERLDGDESTDIFPAITWDRRKDGYRKASFLWRLFRWERDPEKGTSLDILFLPIRRP